MEDAEVNLITTGHKVVVSCIGQTTELETVSLPLRQGILTNALSARIGPDVNG